jgi:hypothetical protein
MTRPKKYSVDYFPHDCNHGKTLFILEQRYGNDGYAFWFKLLELLGSTDGHSLDLNDAALWEFLTSKTRIEADTCNQILNLLAKLQAIDPELWESKIVWSDNFVERIRDAYRNRLSDTPIRPDNLRQKPHEAPQSCAENPQTKLKETKLKETKDISPKKSAKKTKPTQTRIPDNFGISESVRKWAGGKGFDRLDDHLEAFKDAALSRGYEYVDWDSAFKRAIREDWGRVRMNGGNGTHSSPPPVKFYTPPDESGLLTPAPGCPTCGGGGAALNPPGSKQKYRPCECLHPVNEVKNGAVPEATATA